MDEIEKRLAALELVTIELGAWLNPADLEDAIRSIEGGMDEVEPDERDVRLAAVELLEGARKRHSAI